MFYSRVSALRSSYLSHLFFGSFNSGSTSTRTSYLFLSHFTFTETFAMLASVSITLLLAQVCATKGARKDQQTTFKKSNQDKL